MAIDVTHAPDLRKVYLLVFDDFSLHGAGSVTQQFPEINSRYARELLGALVQGKMLTLGEDSDGGDMWQVLTPGTYDDHTREEAEAAIDSWLGIKRTQDALDNRLPARRRTAAKKEPSPCLCGCGELAMSNYRPGHDARHAGAVGREIAANYAVKGFDRRELLAALPSDALKAKAEKVAETTVDKTRKPNTKPTTVEGTAKVGKNEMVARRYPNGLVEYLTLKGDWKTASASATKTFQEG